jgi:NAD-dependent deacetylase
MTLSIEPELVSLFKKDSHVGVLTGAGISAESNVPTFRDAQSGLWANFKAEELATREAFAQNPKMVYDWYRWRRELILKAKPNAGHQALVELSRLLSNFTLITQNVDGLHLEAGSKDLIEMHGSIHRMKCSGAGHHSEWVEDIASVPICKICSTMLRPNIVWFGEMLDRKDLARIESALATCTIFISIGTSGLVYPAAGLMSEARAYGAATLSINPDRSARGEANYFLQGKAGELLPPLVNAISRQLETHG